MSNDGGAALAIVGLFAMSASSGLAAYFLTQQQEDKPSPTPTDEDDVVVTPDEINPSNCQGETMVMKKGCHNTETGEVYDGTPDKCGPGKELWVPDPEAPGYVAAVGDGTCEGELRDCSVDCPTPCSGGEWKQDPSDYCKIITYDNSNPPQKVETRLDGTSVCGTGVVSEILDETRGNFVEARGLGACTKQRVGSCEVACPAGMTASSGCAYYANRQKSANGCMKVDANGDALEYSPDGSNNVDCGESGKQEFFYLPINASGCGRLSEWEPCSGEPCKVHCVGNWRQASPSNPEGWEACTGTCGEQPQKMRKYHISQGARHGGAECTIADEFTDYTNCGSITPCTTPCEGSWSEWSPTCPTCDTSSTSDSRSRTWNTTSTLPPGYLYSPACPTPSTETEYCPATSPCCVVGAWQDGTCASNGFMTQTRNLTENKSGACAPYDSTKEVQCCYQAGNWTAEGGCSPSGKQKYKQTVSENCPSGTDTKYEDCAPCQYRTLESAKTFCQTYESGNYGTLSWSTADKAVRAFKNIIDKPAVGTGLCPTTEVTYEKVGNDCTGTVGYKNQLGGTNYGEEPNSTTSSQREAVVNTRGGWRLKMSGGTTIS